MTDNDSRRFSLDSRHRQNRPLELRCRLCGFLLVAIDEQMADQMGWHEVSRTDGTGLCFRCSKEAT